MAIERDNTEMTSKTPDTRTDTRTNTRTDSKGSEPNAQNSELSPKTHPSGARIEKMMNGSDSERNPTESSLGNGDGDADRRAHVVNTETGTERGEGGEVLRPSERYTPPEDPAEGSRESSTGSPHRDTPETRES